MTSRTHATMEVAVPRGRRSGRKARAAEAPLVSFRTRARDALRAEGYRMTKQRDTLLDVIEHAEGHLDADGIYDLARKRDPRISLSTVYRTLNLLKHHDLVDELHLSEEHHHYEPKSGRPAALPPGLRRLRGGAGGQRGGTGQPQGGAAAGAGLRRHRRPAGRARTLRALPGVTR